MATITVIGFVVVLALGAMVLYSALYDWYWDIRERNHPVRKVAWRDAIEEVPDYSQFPILVRYGCPSGEGVLQWDEFNRAHTEWKEYCSQYHIVFWVGVGEITYKQYEEDIH